MMPFESHVLKQQYCKIGTHRKRHHTGCIGRFVGFLAYNAELEGIPPYAVDPRHTSRMCPVCVHTTNADSNAAIPIRYRAAINQPVAPLPELSVQGIGSTSQLA